MQLLVSTILALIPDEMYIWHVYVIYTQSELMSSQDLRTTAGERIAEPTGLEPPAFDEGSSVCCRVNDGNRSRFRVAAIKAAEG